MKTTRVIAVGATSLALAASYLYVIQGGFGAGHGRFDKALFIMSLPWSAVPWPEALARRDYVWLIVIPLTLNLTLLSLFRFLHGRRRNSNNWWQILSSLL